MATLATFDGEVMDRIRTAAAFNLTRRDLVALFALQGILASGERGTDEAVNRALTVANRFIEREG